MGHFPRKFLESPSSETTGPIEKINRVQKWYGHPLFPGKVWWRSAAEGRREKEKLGDFVFVCHALDLELEYRIGTPEI